MLTEYHAKYFAYELTKRNASDSIQKLAASLADAQVDLNPHQVEAALFAFRSPLSKGAILADEVGLGKFFIPIHTERPEKFKEYFGKSVMTADDGQLIEI